MRISRSKSKGIKRKYIKIIVIIFLIIIPSLAFVTSLIISNIVYNKSSAKAIEESKNPSNPPNNTAFNYIFELSAKKLYRIELERYDSFEEAEKFVKKIKSKRYNSNMKYNAFIIKENGYSVYFGLFNTNEDAEVIKEKIESTKLECKIKEINFNSLNISYDNIDKKFIDIVKDTDNLMENIFAKKGDISYEIASRNNKPSKEQLSELIAIENKITENLIIIMNTPVSSQNTKFKENYVQALKIFEANHLTEEASNYYDIQKSMSYQLEGYDKLISSLSI